MRGRIQRLVLTAVIAAVALFAIPLAVMIRYSVISDEQGELERTALRAAGTVAPGYEQDPIELPVTEAWVSVAIYRVDGSRATGVGPEHLDAALTDALHGVLSVRTRTELVAAVPVTSGENRIAVVRAASPWSRVRARIGSVWAGMGALALIAIGTAALWSARQSRRLSKPLTELAHAWTDLGDGDFTARAAPSGVPEIDRAGEALHNTASRMASLIERERAFSANASHQLRTPLTALRLQLETGLNGPKDSLEVSTRAAMATADQLERTIDDLLELARSSHGPTPHLALHDVFDELRSRWHGVLAAQDRQLQISVQEPQPPRPAASGAAVRQILDVLVDNAYRHGTGTVTVQGRDAEGAVAIDVLDEGRAVDVRMPELTATSGSRRLGLPLAQTLAESQGGRLLLAGYGTQTRFTLLLPSSEQAGPSPLAPATDLPERSAEADQAIAPS